LLPNYANFNFYISYSYFTCNIIPGNMAKKSGSIPKKTKRSSNGGKRLIILAVLVLAVYLIYTNADKLNLPSLKDGSIVPTEKNEKRTPAAKAEKKQPSAKPSAKKDTPPSQATSKNNSESATPAARTSGKDPFAADFAFENNKDFTLPAFTKKDQIIRHEGYTLCYVEEFEQPSWVSYKLTSAQVKGKNDRENDFRPDPEVNTKSALPDDYRGSGYDRGHLAPAADFKSSAVLMSESFFMSNMSPQEPDFNRGIWEKLESRVRTWVKRDEVLYIVTGPVLKGNMAYIGKRNKVAVPPMYYKVVVDLKEPEIKAIGFLMKNEGSNKSLQSFAVTIDEIEKETGLDFFPQLPDDLEKTLEGSLNVKQWFGRSSKDE
jgi:endonuclease G